MQGMTKEIRVLYNDSCPVCRFEIDSYAKLAEKDGLAIGFDRLDKAEGWGLTPEDAARRLHVMQDGRLLSGVAAFVALWAAMPRWRWAARMAGWPVVRPVLGFVYDRVAAPLLYRAHLRRRARKGEI